MRTLNLDQTVMVTGGIWCTYDGKACSNCANLIEIAGNDCSIVTGHLHAQTDSFDTNSLVMGAAATWVGAVGGLAAGYCFGFGAIATAGIGIGLGVLIGVAYATTHNV